MKLVVINACVRQADSRTLRIAEPVISALAGRYDVVRYDLPEMECVSALTPSSFAERGEGKIPSWAMAAARDISEADRILIAARPLQGSESSLHYNARYGYRYRLFA